MKLFLQQVSLTEVSAGLVWSVALNRYEELLKTWEAEVTVCLDASCLLCFMCNRQTLKSLCTQTVKSSPFLLLITKSVHCKLKKDISI